MVEYSRRDPHLRSNYDRSVDAKIVIMGNTGVGKTSLLHRYTQNKFEPKNTTSTTGAFFVTKKIHVHGVRVRLQLWDTAGQERFRSMVSRFLSRLSVVRHSADNLDRRHLCTIEGQTLLCCCTISRTHPLSTTFAAGWRVCLLQTLTKVAADVPCFTELKSNCSPDLVIYIVGAKADLHQHRQISSDLARLSLHKWFPPPRAPTPPPPPPPSTFSYMRPRFTSFTSMRSVPLPFPVKQPLTPSGETDDGYDSHSSGLTRSSTSAAYIRPRTKSGGALLQRANTTGAQPHSVQSRFSAHAGYWNDKGDSSGNSQNEEEEDPDDVESTEWGLEKGMELFEVSAKDDTGACSAPFDLCQ
jgi:GTPase SAR1 family protein